MTLRYYGEKIGELSFYREARLSSKYRGLCDACIAMPLIKRGYKVISYWNGKLEDWGVWTTDLAVLYKSHEKKAMKTKKYVRRKNASLPLIKRWLKKGVPVIAEVLAGRFYRTKEIGTHMILIIGFNKKGFIICDPWGDENFVFYKDFVKAWFPTKRFGRSMIVIEPTSRSKSRQRRGA